MNEELQENEIQNHIKKILNKNFFIYISCFEFIVGMLFRVFTGSDDQVKTMLN